MHGCCSSNAWEGYKHTVRRCNHMLSVFVSTDKPASSLTEQCHGKPPISIANPDNLCYYLSAVWRKAFSTGSGRRVFHICPSPVTQIPWWFLFRLWKGRTAELTGNSSFLLWHRSVNEIWQNIFRLPLAYICVKCCFKWKGVCSGRTHQLSSPFLCRGCPFFPVWVEFISRSLLSYFMLKY